MTSYKFRKFPCPVCKKTIVEPWDICDECGYENQGIDYDNGFKGPNEMTLTEAIEAYKKGKPAK